jgi:tetratricopeptide (TPR) repeat protein
MLCYPISRLANAFRTAGVVYIRSANIFVKLLLVFFLFGVIYGCASPASQAIKRGDDLLVTRNYYGASQEYLTALGLEPAHKDAKMKLCQTSKPAYDQKLEMASSYEKTSDFESALPQYNDLASFIEKLNSYNCLNFVPVNAKQKVVEMKSGSSEKYYREAERCFSNEDYNTAVSNYQQALRHNNPYKDCRDKIAESYYRLGAKAERQKSYREAGNKYLDCNEALSGYKDAADRATSLFYSLGVSFLKKGLCRNAYDDLSLASKINSSFKDISSKINEAESCALSKVAFMRFDNPTGRDISGMSIGDFIFDEIKTKLQNRASKFMRTIERDELSAVLGEQRLGEKGITDDYATFKQLRGVHYLIFGKLTQVKSEQPNERQQSMKTTGTQYYTCIKQGRRGSYEDTCRRDIPIYYTQHSAKLDVALTGSIKVVSVATGEQIIFHNISSRRSDTITYADVNSDVSSNIEVPSGLEELVKSRRELKDKDDCVKEMISEIASEMVQKILEKIDRAKTISDPAELTMIR